MFESVGDTDRMSAIDTGAMGDGPFPAELDRINWGAVLMPGLWSLCHGMWAWWLIEAVLWVAWMFGAWQLRVLGGGRSDSLPVLVGLLIWGVLSWSVAVWFGAHGNERIWRREVSRRSLGLSGHSISGFRGNQRVWAWGTGLWALLGVGSMASNLWMDTPKGYGGMIGMASFIGIEAAALGIAWMIDRRRSESAADLLEP